MRKKTLQTLLNYKERLEKLAQESLFEANKVKAEILNQIRQVELKAGTLKQDCDQKKNSGMNIIELLAFEDAIDHTTLKIKELEASLAEQQAVVDDCQRALTKAGQEKKLMEKLAEKKMDELKKAILKQEMKDIDEVASNHDRRDQ